MNQFALRLAGRFTFTLTAFALTLVSGVVANAAPMPGTASSKLVSPQIGLYRSPLGFMISSGNSGWIHAEPPKDNKFIATLYRAPSNNPLPGAKGANQDAAAGASLSVRVDELKKEMPIDKYIQRWVKEYPKYGFDVLGSQSFSQNKQRGYVVDLINRDGGKQLRQVVFLKNRRAIIMTCRDSIPTFKEALKGCNQIIRTFNWE